MQWLYGSGEGAAMSLQAYRGFADHALAALRRRPRSSVVVAKGASLAAPRFVPCGRKPLAVLLDVDETALQNLGYEYALARRSRSSDSKLLDRWQEAPRREAAAMPGAAAALGALRARGITVIFNSNRETKDGAATAATIAAAGLGVARPGSTLLLRGDVDGQGGKDGRRAFAAARYCVVAMAGDQLADFADGFNDRALTIGQRRDLAASAPFAALWGHGWHLLSNPVYGPGLKGSIEDVFPPAVRWGNEEGTGK
jgi:predicted secreted acid phosphatase